MKYYTNEDGKFLYESNSNFSIWAEEDPNENHYEVIVKTGKIRPKSNNEFVIEPQQEVEFIKL